MKTVLLEIPTMTRIHKQQAVSDSIKKLGITNVITQRGRAEVTCPDTLLKVEIIRAIEDAGFIVKY
jgi:hypothetical protein